MIGMSACTGRIGNVIVYRIGSKQYARSMPMAVRNPRTPLQEANRMRFAELNRLAGVLAHVAYSCFPRLTLVQVRRLFVQWNKYAVIVTPEFGLRVDWCGLTVSQGFLEPPHVEVETEGREVRFLKHRQKHEGWCRGDDMLYAVVLDAARMAAVLFPLGIRRDAGEIKWTLPGEVLWEERFVYVFAVGHDGSSASKSVCVCLR